MEQLNVKVGDKVLLSGGYSYNHYEKICEVEKVTPTGRIRLKGHAEQFNKYGEKWDAKYGTLLVVFLYFLRKWKRN